MQLPAEFEQRMRQMLGEEYDAFYASLDNFGINAGIRINTIKQGAFEAVRGEFTLGEHIPWCSDGFYVDKGMVSGNHPYHAAGLFYFQEPSAMAAAEALPVYDGDYILDLCAAPGGKTTQAAAKLAGSGMVVANEINAGRARILSENVERLGFSNIIVTNEPPQKLEDRFPQFFDKIIVDAPCSGEGMFRKEPQAVEEWSKEHTYSCGMRQKNILDSAVKMLRGGGYILYSTCTFAPAENEEIAEYLLSEYPFLELCEIPKLDMLSEAVSEWGGGEHDLSYAKRIFPHRHNGEGHFIALFRHTGEKNERIDGKKNGSQKRAKQTATLDDIIKAYKEFELKTLKIKLDGVFCAFGEKLYLLPAEIDTDKLKILRAGLELGVYKKGRFEPSHALCLALKSEDFVNTVDLEADSDGIKSYYSGNILPCEYNGWCAVTVNGYPTGWGKASGGVLKNHYPKALRIY